MHVSEIVAIVVKRIVNYVNIMFEFVWDTCNNFLKIHLHLAAILSLEKGKLNLF